MADVLFIQELFYEYNGVMVLSALLKQHGVSTDLLITKDEQEVLSFIDNEKPKLVCF